MVRSGSNGPQHGTADIVSFRQRPGGHWPGDAWRLQVQETGGYLFTEAQPDLLYRQGTQERQDRSDTSGRRLPREVVHGGTEQGGYLQRGSQERTGRSKAI